MAALLNRIKQKRNGFSLIEVLIAMFILVVVGVAFLVTLQYAIKANALDKAHSTAESLARSQLENIKQSPYLDFSKDVGVGDGYRTDANYALVSVPTNYTIDVRVEPFNAGSAAFWDYDTDKIQSNPDIFPSDDKMQKITVTVVFNTGGSSIIWDASVIVEGYKVER